jgi:protein-disulfide isomerase
MEDRRRALWILIALFGVLSALLIWSFAYRAATTFETGKPPAIPQPKLPDPIRPEIRSTDQARGSSDPKAVVIVEFADFSCLYCRASEPELRAVLTEDKNVRHIWRDMPVASDSPSGMLAASAGRCAAEQNRFWEMHDALMDASRLDTPTITTISRTIGLNSLTFDECLSSGRHVASIQQDIEIAREAGMTGAPTFFIGNKTVLTGYVTAADLRWAILKAKFGQ